MFYKWSLTVILNLIQADLPSVNNIEMYITEQRSHSYTMYNVTKMNNESIFYDTTSDYVVYIAILLESGSLIHII